METIVTCFVTGQKINASTIPPILISNFGSQTFDFYFRLSTFNFLISGFEFLIYDFILRI